MNYNNGYNPISALLKDPVISTKDCGDILDALRSRSQEIELTEADRISLNGDFQELEILLSGPNGDPIQRLDIISVISDPAEISSKLYGQNYNNNQINRGNGK